MANEVQNNAEVSEAQKQEAKLAQVTAVFGTFDKLDKEAVPEPAFDKMLEKVSKANNSARELIQHAAIQAMLIAMDEKRQNYDWATRLSNAVETSLSPYAKIQLRLWFETYGPFA